MTTARSLTRPALAIFVALAASTAGIARAWEEDHLILLPLVMEGGAAGRVDEMTQALIETVAAREVARTSGACVVAPKDLRAIERDPQRAPTACGQPATVALAARHVVHVAIGQSTSGWRLTGRWIDRRASEILIEADLERDELGPLLEAMPEYFIALAEEAAAYPRPEGRLLGVLANAKPSDCESLTQRPVDAEAIVSWSAPGAWFAKEYGPVRTARAWQGRAVALARRRAVAESVRGAFTWVLAQLPETSRQVIHDNALAFDDWAKLHVTTFGYAEWVAKEAVLEERIETAERSARSMVRVCVDVVRLRAVVDRRVALLDPAGKPAVVVIAVDRELGQALADFGQGFAFAPRAVERAKPLPNPDYRKGRAFIQKLLHDNDATVAILADLQLQERVTSPDRPVEVQIDLEAVNRDGLSLAVTRLRERPKGANLEVALGRVTATWARLAQPALEDFYLRLRRP